jgi:hypothetical protein
MSYQYQNIAKFVALRANQLGGEGEDIRYGT